MRRLVSLLGCLVLLLAAVPAGANPADLCRDAAARMAVRHAIPPAVMQAITLVETRRTVGGQSGPWPWTLNIAGEGLWFDRPQQALSRAEAAIAAGTTSVDLGCFQLNFRWHGMHFDSIGAMLDPETSGDYAARFLRALKDETGDWLRAAGHYHSRTPEHSARYRRLIAAALERLPDDTALAALAPAPPRAGPVSATGPAARRPFITLPRSTATLARPGAVALSALTGASGALFARSPR